MWVDNLVMEKAEEIGKPVLILCSKHMHYIVSYLAFSYLMIAIFNWQDGTTCSLLLKVHDIA